MVSVVVAGIILMDVLMLVIVFISITMRMTFHIFPVNILPFSWI